MYTFETTLGGRSFVVETGKMAKQANGAVLVRYGETVVLVTATASAEPREGVDFFPLTVDYEEKMYAVGKIPGGFIKREGRPAESAILNSRLIDRPIRPLFPEGYRNDVQIVATVLSVEQDNAPEIAGMIGASCALSISDIPFLGPIAGVRVGRIDGEFVINPTVEQREKSDLNLTVAGSYDAVMMVEAGANELSEEVVLDAILFGHKEIKRLVKFQQEMMEKCGKEKHQPKLFTVPEELVNAIHEYTYDKFDAAVRDADKLRRDEHVAEVKAQTGGDVFVLERELEIIEKRATDVDPEIQEEYKTFLRHLMSLCRKYEYELLPEMQEKVMTAALAAAGLTAETEHTQVKIGFTCPKETSDLNLFVNMTKLNGIQIDAVNLMTENGNQKVTMTLDGKITDAGMRCLLCQIGKEAEEFRILELISI